MKEAGAMLGAVLIAAAAFMVGSKYSKFPEPTGPPAIEAKDPLALPDKALTLPALVKIAKGEPAELRAETRGQQVVWMPLDAELQLRPLDKKSVWVWANTPGTYRVIAWTAVNGLPTVNALCQVQVSDATSATEEKKQ